MNAKRLMILATLSGSFGCSSSRDYRPVDPVVQAKLPSVPMTPVASPVHTVGFQNTADSPAKAAPVNVDEFVKLAIQRNPRLGKATFAIDATQGKYIQAGLYPNPQLAVQGDELGDVTGPGGIWSAPHLSQEIVTGKKLRLSQAIAATEVNQATLSLLSER
jgi:cobalt-zinc-cadmium efflux system outer membrane protein